MLFYLVRHGQKQAIPFDPPLTDIGVKQAELTAEYLKDIPFKKVIASPKLRTKQTAEIIANPHNITVQSDLRLIERMEWENDETFDEFIAEWSKSDLDRSFQPKTGESSVNKGNIMKVVIDELTHNIDGDVLLVTHGGAIGDLLRNLFGEDNVPHRIDPITNAPHVLISECSVTIIELNNGKFELKKLNDISHLPIPVI
jgi:broad specificity phosphatase PhoE